MSKFSTQTFYGYTNWTAPAGVESVSITPVYKTNSVSSDPTGNLIMGMARTFSGQTYAWGYNFYGNLGVGDVIARSSPVSVLGGLNFTKIVCDETSAHGITSTGQIYSWGANTIGQLGVGDLISRSSPVAVVGGLTFSDVLNNTQASIYGITASGALYGWGNNQYGELGSGVIGGSLSSPHAVLGGLSFSQISFGFNNVFGLTTSGQLYSWGHNLNGELGLGDQTNRASPNAVLGGLTFSQVLGTYNGIYGLTVSGQLYAWGSNSNGALGVGDTIYRSSPVAVVGGLTFSRIFSDYNGSNVYGLTPGGKLYAWGANSNGSLGIGNSVPQSSPVAVLGGLTFSNMGVGSASGDSAFAMTGTGQVYAWGANVFGQLGIGNILNQSSPVAVVGGLTFSQIIPSYSYTFGLTTTGALYGWGINANGELGSGNTTTVSSPVAVVGGLTFNTFPQTPFSANLNQPMNLTVIPGTTYNIVLNPGTSYFGSIPIGYGPLSKVLVSYYAQ